MLSPALVWKILPLVFSTRASTVLIALGYIVSSGPAYDLEDPVSKDKN